MPCLDTPKSTACHSIHPKKREGIRELFVNKIIETKRADGHHRLFSLKLLF